METLLLATNDIPNLRPTWFGEPVEGVTGCWRTPERKFQTVPMLRIGTPADLDGQGENDSPVLEMAIVNMKVSWSGFPVVCAARTHVFFSHVVLVVVPFVLWKKASPRLSPDYGPSSAGSPFQELSSPVRFSGLDPGTMDKRSSETPFLACHHPADHKNDTHSKNNNTKTDTSSATGQSIRSSRVGTRSIIFLSSLGVCAMV